MVNYNPRAPDVLGNEWVMTHDHKSRVFAGAPGRRMRLPSTVAETITALKMSVEVNPQLRAETYTVIDVVPEGNEVLPLFTPVELIPTGTDGTGTWHRGDQSTNNLHLDVDEDATLWYPGAPAQATYVETATPADIFRTTYDVTAFNTGGSHQNARIGFVEIRAIYAANTGFRRLHTYLTFAGTIRNPAGGSIRDVHGYGAPYVFWYGELNPNTLKPWTPADIVGFGSGGTTRVNITSAEASTDHWPRIHAVRVFVWCAQTENRVAAGVWKRPLAMASRLANVQTDSLITLPSGAANWSKPSSGNFLYLWRQSVSPSLFGAVNADDVRWNGAYQDLGPAGQPAGVVYPLQTTGLAPPPAGALASEFVTYDQFGRSGEAFAGANTGQAAYALGLLRSDAAMSADSQPYRLDLADLGSVTSTQKLGQRVTPGSSVTYLGVRFPIIPPASGSPTLTVEVRRVSDNVLMGGSFTITAAAARALPSWTMGGGSTGWRYVTGFLSSGAALVSGTAYEIRVTTSAGGTWIMAVPDCSLANTTSFGGSTNGAFIGSTHFADRELSINLVRQPDPPQTPAAAQTDVACPTFSDANTTVKHINVTWTQPAVGLGASFARYEIERQLAGGAWLRVANVLAAATVTWQDRTCPRQTLAAYRIRAVATDGRFSNWATTGNVTITDPRPMLILSSNHNLFRHFVHFYEITDSADAETVYPILSAEGDELVRIHGASYQVAFIDPDDRGMAWRTRISLAQDTITTVGMARFAALRDLVRDVDIPYVAALDHQGNHVLGHVAVREGVQTQPLHHYTAALEITPTHSEPVPVDV